MIHDTAEEQHDILGKFAPPNSNMSSCMSTGYAPCSKTSCTNTLLGLSRPAFGNDPVGDHPVSMTLCHEAGLEDTSLVLDSCNYSLDRTP